MSDLRDHVHRLEQHALLFVGRSPVVWVHPGFLSQLNQIVADALGAGRAASLRSRAAHEAYHLLLKPLVARLDGAEARVRAGAELFANCGFGALDCAFDESGGIAEGRDLAALPAGATTHAFSTGFLAALGEVAHGLPAGTLEVVEASCASGGDEHCTFEISRSGRGLDVQGISHGDTLGVLPPPFEKTGEGEVWQHVDAALFDARPSEGRLKCGDTPLCLIATNYLNHVVGRVLQDVTDEKPDVVEAAQELLRVAARESHRALIGGLIGEPDSDEDPRARVDAACAAASALGLGAMSVSEANPDRFVIESPGTCESVYAKVFKGGALEDAPCFLFEGAAASCLDLMEPSPHLAHEVSCLRRGDDRCRVIVERT